MKLGHKADATCHSHVEIADVRVLLKTVPNTGLVAHRARKAENFY